MDRLDVLEHVVKQDRQQIDEIDPLQRAGHDGGGAQGVQHRHGAQAPAPVTVSVEQVGQRLHDDGLVLPVAGIVLGQALAGDDEHHHVVAVHRSR